MEEVKKYIVGIDEVGRGPLAGPVAVGIVAIRGDYYEELKNGKLFWKGKDSKKLTEKRRKESFEKIKELKAQGALIYGVFFEPNAVIDRYGIVAAIQMAVEKGLRNLIGTEGEKKEDLTRGYEENATKEEKIGQDRRAILLDLEEKQKTEKSTDGEIVGGIEDIGSEEAGSKNYVEGIDAIFPAGARRVGPGDCRVLLDGGLKAPIEYADQQSIIKGDESELIISLASIAAKVTRDARMEQLAETIPYYDLKNNKGYGTARHIADLRQYGPCELHRRSFIRRLT